MITIKEKNFLSAVVYVHNNEDNIKIFLESIMEKLDDNFETFEIICINDASEDNSVKMIKSIDLTTYNCSLSIINMSYYQGLEAGMNAGVDIAIGDFVFEFDKIYIDYNLNFIIEIYKNSLKGFDIVSASNKKRKLTSTLFYKIFNRSANIQNKLETESFRILSRRAINRIHSMSKTIPYRKALYSNCGLKLNIMYYQSTSLESKVKEDKIFKQRYTTAFDSLILFTNLGYKLAISLTVIMMLATLAGIIYTIVVYLLGNPIQGYTTMMLLLTGSFFAVFAVLSIVIKYLSVLVNLIFKQQKYIVESVEKISK